ncbi:Glutamate receptor 2 [Armadillidium vulgare]|nr:Glutamate receptor 2 [Armadillidium vulgare]
MTTRIPPYLKIKKNATDQNFVDGFLADVWHSLQKFMNFTYCSLNSFHGTPRGPNQTWSGFIGWIQIGYLDIAIAPVVLSARRFEVMDFSIPYMTTKTKFYIRRPDKSSGWDLYILPFGLEMWISILFFIFITALSLWGMGYLWKLYTGQDMSFKLGQISWAIFSGFLLQAKPSLPFRTFEDLRDLEDWKVSVFTNSVFSADLKYANKGSALREIWDNKIVKYWQETLVSTNANGLRTVLKGKITYYGLESSTAYSLYKELSDSESEIIIDTGVGKNIRQSYSPCLSRSTRISLNSSIISDYAVHYFWNWSRVVCSGVFHRGCNQKCCFQK